MLFLPAEIQSNSGSAASFLNLFRMGNVPVATNENFLAAFF